MAMGCNACPGTIISEGPLDGGDGGNVDSGTSDGGPGSDGGPSFDAGIYSVLQHHKSPSRDGVFVDPAFTLSGIANLRLDTGFTANTGPGAVFAQPLFMESGPLGSGAVFVATENNDVFALNATNGNQLWKTHLGAPVPTSTGMTSGCGSIYPLGVTSAPVIDAAARRLYLAGAGLPSDGGTVGTHMVYALSVDTGAVLWSEDVQRLVPGFLAVTENQRSALALVNGTLYVAYGGLDGDCDPYHGWVVGFPVANPTQVTAWSTPLQVGADALSGSGIWGPSGIASDGVSLFVATGNNHGSYASSWDGGWGAATGDGDAVLRLDPGPTFTFGPANYFAPSNFVSLDSADYDLGSIGPVLFDVPGATPSHLAVAYGKSRAPWLVNRDNLGGTGGQLSTTSTAPNSDEFGALIAYSTSTSTYVGFPAGFSDCSGGGANLTVLKVSAANPPQFSMGWCAGSNGNAAPIVSESAPGVEAVVWAVTGNAALAAYDGDTGQPLTLADGGALPSVPANMQHWVSPIIAKGRLYVPTDGALYAFTVQ
jgi:hypothetical protein